MLSENGMVNVGRNGERKEMTRRLTIERKVKNLEHPFDRLKELDQHRGGWRRRLCGFIKGLSSFVSHISGRGINMTRDRFPQ